MRLPSARATRLDCSISALKTTAGIRRRGNTLQWRLPKPASSRRSQQWLWSAQATTEWVRSLVQPQHLSFCIIGLVTLVKREQTTFGDNLMHQTTVLGSMVCAVQFSRVTMKSMYSLDGKNTCLLTIRPAFKIIFSAFCNSYHFQSKNLHRLHSSFPWSVYSNSKHPKKYIQKRGVFPTVTLESTSRETVHMPKRINQGMSHNFLWQRYSHADRLIYVMAETDRAIPSHQQNGGTPSVSW